MADPFFTFKEYLKYRWNAKNSHGLHSPFLFELYTQVIRKHHKVIEKKLLKIRKSISNQKGSLTYIDPKDGRHLTSSISALAKKSAASHRFSFFLLKLINHFGYATVLETGTSLGINACYLSHSTVDHIITIEGSEEVASLAREHLQNYAEHPVDLIIGRVQDRFATSLEQSNPELVFLDADHRGETIRFYLSEIRKQQTVKCIVIHDIHWSRDMHYTWEKIRTDKQYPLTIDIFQAGVIFTDHPIEKQHFLLKF